MRISAVQARIKHEPVCKYARHGRSWESEHVCSPPRDVTLEIIQFDEERSHEAVDNTSATRGGHLPLTFRRELRTGDLSFQP